EDTSPIWLQKVAHSIVPQTFNVGRKLGISDEDMDILKLDLKGHSEEISYQILRKWYSGFKGFNPKVILHDVLVECSLSEVAERHLGQKTIGNSGLNLQNRK
ncbi:unnamed protein product, partial [Owenia fusiformis]